MAVLLALSLMASMFSVLNSPATANGEAGSFEIDGNRLDNTGTGEPIDWSTAETADNPATVTPIPDGSGKDDDSFGLGSKNLKPGQWVCQEGSVPPKDDILSGNVALRQVGDDQWAYVDFFRSSPNGSANVDYEFNQSGDPNPSCPELPLRTEGDVLIAFDAEKGGKNITVRAFVWDPNDTVPGTGQFVASDSLAEHATWDGAVNIPNTIPATTTSPAPAAGTYGEASLNLTETIGEIVCGQFETVFIKSRSSREINSALKDRTDRQPLNLANCPQSDLAKAVRNVTSEAPGPDEDDFAESVNASPGDIIEYQLTYTNEGAVTATNVVVSDPIPDHSSFLNCSDACDSITDPTQVSWDLGDIGGGDSVVVTFQVSLDQTFPAGPTDVVNVASVDTEEEDPKDSDPVIVTVSASPASSLAKGVRNVTSAAPGPDEDDFAESVDASPGDTIEYRFTYSNGGDAAATGVSITDEVPELSTFESCSDGCTRDPVGGAGPGTVLTWSIGEVAPDATAVVTFQTVLDAEFARNGASIVNIGSTGSDQEEPSDSNPTTVSVVADPDSSLAKLVRNVSTELPQPLGSFTTSVDASPGDIIEYELTYTNNGGPADDVSITDPVPAHSTFSFCTGGCTTTGTSPGDTITWELGAVAAGGTVTVTFQVTLDALFAQNTTTIPNVATAHDTVGDTDSPNASVVVDAPPASGLTKAAANLTNPEGNAHPGDIIEYTLTYTNTGSGPAENVVVSDPVPSDTTFDSCSDDCTTDGPPVTVVSWSLGDVAAGADPIVRTFQVTLDSTFGSGTTQVCNTGTATDQEGGHDSDPACITVEAHPNLAVTKASGATQIGVGQTVTYTIGYSNTGDGDATGVVVTDPIPGDTEFVSCSDDCNVSDGIATWTIGDVPAGTSDSVSLTVRVLSTTGCSICNVATLTSPDQPDGAESNEVCVGGDPTPRPDLAHASGSAFGASLTEVNPILPISTGELAAVSTMADGNPATADPAHDHEDDRLLNVAVPPPAPGSVLDVDVLETTSDSDIFDSPASARSQSIAETANVNILNGLVTANVVRAVAEANADGTSSSVSSVGSTIKNLKVNGQSINQISPNMRVDLPALVFGAGSYVAIHEEIKSALAPTGLSGGTFEADITVNMIRVHIADKLVVLAGAQPLDVTVSSATALADFPQLVRCEAQPTQAVSGHAFMLSATTDPAILPIMQGLVEIPATGGYAHQGYVEANVPGNGSVATAGVWATDTTGTLGPTASTASSYAEAVNVCILKNASNVCTVSAEAVRSQANSTADATSASSGDGGPTRTFLAKVNILGSPVASSANNKVVDLPGIGYVVLNEQVPDAAAPGHTGLTVRAIHVVITKGVNPFNLPIGADIIVAEAHSDATFLPPAP